MKKWVVLILLFTMVAAGAVREFDEDLLVPKLIVDSLTLDTNSIESGTGDIATSGTVDGRDISADGSVLDTLDSDLGDITTSEADQVENIDANTISNSQWSFLGSMDQGVATTDSVLFNDMETGSFLTFPEVATPSNPAASKHKLYFKNDGNVYKLDSSGTEAQIGGGGGTGTKNYVSLSNSLFESGTGDWIAYDDVSDFVDGTGGTPSAISVSTTTTSGEILEGGQSLQITKAASDATNEGVSVLTDTIDRQDFGKKLSCSIQVDADDSNYTSGDLRIFAFDTTNSAELAVVNDDNGDIPKRVGRVDFDVILDGTPGSETQEFRLALHVETDSATASSWNIFVDDVRCGPDSKIPAPIITEWEPFTVVSSWNSNVTWTGRMRRDGDTLELNIYGTLSGAPNAAQLTFDLPGTLQFDTDKLAAGSDRDQTFIKVGSFRDDSAGFKFELTGGDFQDSNTFRPFHVVEQNETTNLAQQLVIDESQPITWASGDEIQFLAEMPIEGWSQGAIISTKERSQEVVKARVYKGSLQNVTSTGTRTVTFDTTAFDTHNIFDDANDSFVAPSPGVYLINANARISSLTPSDSFQLLIDVGGTTQATWNSNYTDSVSNAQVTAIVELNKDDVVTLEVDSSGDSNYNVDSGLTGTYFEIVKLPDFTDVGVFGEHERVETEITSNTTESSGSFTDVTGASIPLTPGTWIIGYDVSVELNDTAAGPNTINAELEITDSSNNSISQSKSFYQLKLDNDSATLMANKSTEITITSSDTYKLRLKGDGGSNQEASVKGVISNSESTFWAERHQ